MTIALGIDTGGTYTDAALIDQDTGQVLASSKSLTTHDDLSRGIVGAVSAVLGVLTGTRPVRSCSSRGRRTLAWLAFRRPWPQTRS